MERGWSEGNSVWLTIGHWQEILASCFLLGCLKSVETRAGKAVEGRRGYPMLCNQCVNERGSRKTCAMLTGKDFLISFSARTMWHSEWLRPMFSLEKKGENCLWQVEHYGCTAKFMRMCVSDYPFKYIGGVACLRVRLNLKLSRCRQNPKSAKNFYPKFRCCRVQSEGSFRMDFLSSI